ncbi:hypothetical protein AB0I66_26950 [Streptomyces sp. NPDC050439]|uniref:hypothetical protein n=1 Tax=unclassified Streptomyces TaxID=2593676 RepID=UPI00343F1EF9
MYSYVGNQRFLGSLEFAELAQGFDDIQDATAPDLPDDFRDLFVGEVGESEKAFAARAAAAEDVFAELIEIKQADENDSIAALNALYASSLMHVTMLRPNSRTQIVGSPRKAA